MVGVLVVLTKAFTIPADAGLQLEDPDDPVLGGRKRRFFSSGMPEGKTGCRAAASHVASPQLLRRDKVAVFPQTKLA